MQRGAEVAIKLFVTILDLLVVAAVLYAAVKVFPLYVAYRGFIEAMSLDARFIHVETGSTEQLRDAIYTDAQREGIPLDRENIKVDASHLGTRVTADYTVPIDLPFFHPHLRIHLQFPEQKLHLSPFQSFAL